MIRDMTSEHPYMSTIIGLFAIALAAALIFVGTTQAWCWSSTRRELNFRWLDRNTRPCEEKEMLV